MASTLITIRRGLAALALISILSCCTLIAEAPASSAASPAFLVVDEERSQPVEPRPLRGDAGFSADRLPEDAQLWHEELRSALADDEQMEQMIAWAESDDLYAYGRHVQLHVVSLLSAFRVTGDLALLDAVDDMTQRMRDRLDDSWRGPAANDAGGRDGYSNWVWRKGGSDTHEGRDVHETDEMRTHALVAEVAWAFENNRDLDSPGGVDYGERADFWSDYLRDHFEAKWRERNEVRWPNFPFLARDYVHPTTAFVRYHHYMHLLTGEVPYRQEAERLSNMVFREMREAETPEGTALVWPRGLTHNGNDHHYLMPSTYTTYVFADALDLHFEGVLGWADERLPRYMARSLALLMLQVDSERVARDLGGGEGRSGLRPTSAREWEGLNEQEFAVKAFALLAGWDETARIRTFAEQAYESLPTHRSYVHIPAGLLVDALTDP